MSADLRCPNCGSGEAEVRHGPVTLMAPSEYVSNGQRHFHDPNIGGTYYNCRACGKRWSPPDQRQCPADGCDYYSRKQEVSA